MKGKRYRHDLKIIAIYKSDIKLMGREYLWINDGCCPKLRPGREYLIMGRKDEVRMGKDSKEKSSNKLIKHKIVRNVTDADWRFETRLFLDNADYWHAWKNKYSAGMIKSSQKLKCKSGKRRKIVT